MEGVLLIVSGPSGAGKGTVVRKLVEDHGYALSVSATTRSPRPGEEEGIHYFFKTQDEFLAMQEQDQLLEWAEFCGHCYGTPREYVEQRLVKGESVVLEIEVQGALQVKKKMPQAVLVFLMPPSREELEYRLSMRGTEDAATIARRIQRATEEVGLLARYDYVVINDMVETAEARLETIMAAEKLRAYRNLDLGLKF